MTRRLPSGNRFQLYCRRGLSERRVSALRKNAQDKKCLSALSCPRTARGVVKGHWLSHTLVVD